MIKRILFIGVISLGGLVNAASAASYAYAGQQKNWYPIAAFSAGAAMTSNLGESKTFPIQDPTTDQFFTYTVKSGSQSSANLGGFLGAEWPIHSSWALQAGIDYNQTAPYKVSGVLVQGADTISADTYNYYYHISTKQLLAEGKLSYLLSNCLRPYVLVGLGAAFNSAYNYYTTVPPFLTFTRMYKDNNTTAFSYAFGVGIDADIAPHVRLGVGYRFADLGKINLGSATIDTTSVSGTLTQSHLYSNQVLGQLTFVL
jgi:opacity protein-like surface antigen